MDPRSQPHSFSDELAAKLWNAYRNADPVPSPSRLGTPISRSRAEQAAAELLAQLYREGAVLAGWKIGANSPSVRQKLGAKSPFIAPVTTRTVHTSGIKLQSADFIKPLIEAEIAIVATEDGDRLAACSEIADCRFSDWDIDIAEAIADFGLHGALIMAPPRLDLDLDPQQTMSVAVFHDGNQQTTGETDIGSIFETARQCGWKQDRELPGLVCATGAIPSPVALQPGEWRLDFAALGAVEFVVA